MSRVLLVCPEPLGHNQPAGIGIRFLEMKKVLEADGHAVTLLAAPISPIELHQASAAHDCAVVQGHIANDYFSHARAIPTVVDLYDPFIVENLHYYSSRGAEVFAHDHATLLSSLLRGDTFLCASQAQRLFYLGMLIATGRLNPAIFENDPHLDSLLRIAPFGVSEPRDWPAKRPNAVLFGGVYDWYDPLLAIDAVAIARETIADLTLTFNTHPNADVTPQGQLARAIAYAREKRYDFVEFTPWVPYADRGAFYDRFACALLTFPQSLETDLSMRTRVYDYLWGGLPIVTSSAPGTNELIERYGAGRVVDSNDPEAYANAIVEMLRPSPSNPATRQLSNFVVDHQWSRTLQPLVEFCRAPKFDETKEQFVVRMYPPAQPKTLIEKIKRRIGGRA